MRNIILSANGNLIDSARNRAREQKTTLNVEFRKWLEQYASSNSEKKKRVQNYQEFMSELYNTSTRGEKFTRDEMNER